MTKKRSVSGEFDASDLTTRPDKKVISKHDQITVDRLEFQRMVSRQSELEQRTNSLMRAIAEQGAAMRSLQADVEGRLELVVKMIDQAIGRKRNGESR